MAAGEAQRADARARARACTSLELGWRKWGKASDEGRAALSACANALTRKAYAEGDAWGPLSDCADVQLRVATHAAAQHRAARDELTLAIDRLAAVVDGMRTAVDALRAHAAASAARARGARSDAEPSSPESSHGRRPGSDVAGCEQLARLADRAVRALERELRLRRAIAAEIARGAPSALPAFAEKTTKLYVSAWVLQPYVDERWVDEFLAALRSVDEPAPHRSPGRSPASKTASPAL